MSTPEQMPSEARLRELLVGRSVQRVEVRNEQPDRWTSGPTGFLHLSDGTVLKVWGNDGGCSCNAGDYPLARLAAFDNVITNVEVEDRSIGDDSGPCFVCRAQWCGEHDGWYRVHVFAGQERATLASFEGTDGNGYYGTGWWLSVTNLDGAP